VLPAGRLCNRILAVDGLLSTWDLLSVKQTALRANWLSFVYRSLSSQLQKLQSLASKVTATCITVSLLCRCLSPSFCVNILCIFDFELPCCCCWLGRATGSASDLYSPVYSARSDSTQQAVELSWVDRALWTGLKKREYWYFGGCDLTGALHLDEFQSAPTSPLSSWQKTPSCAGNWLL